MDTNTKALTEYMTNVYRVESQIYEHQAMIDEFEKIIRECDSGTLSSSRNSLIGKYESSGSSYTKSKNKVAACSDKINEINNTLSRTRTAPALTASQPVMPKPSRGLRGVFGFLAVLGALEAIGGLLLQQGCIAIIGLLAGGFLGFLYFCIRKTDNANHQAYLKAVDEYNKKAEEWTKATEAHQNMRADLQNQLTQAKAALEIARGERDAERAKWLAKVKDIARRNISSIQTSLTNLHITRDKLYAAGNIFPKYRNLPCVATMLEYLQAGRVTELEGTAGAYNLYESELRQNIIIGRLGDIINMLGEIQQNQYNLYQTVSQMNRTLQKIDSDMQSQIRLMEKSVNLQSRQLELAAVTASCAAATAANTEAIKYLSLVN